MKLIFENWRQLMKETEESSAASQRGIEAGLGFGGMASATRKAREPEAYQELVDLDLEDAYERATQLYGKENPGKYFTIRVFLDNLDHVKAKYPEAFPDTPQATPTQPPSIRVEKMYTALYSMSNQLTDPKVRVKYEKALGAINALLRVL